MKKSLRFLPHLCISLLCVSLLSGCGVVARVATEAALKKLAPGSSGSGVDSAYVASLTPLNSGAGLVVFEPQFAPASTKWANLGAGCSRYLQVHVAGQGALGKTPLWGMVDDARRQLNLADLKLSATQAREVAKKLGVTHFLVGKVSGAGEKVALSYELLEVAGGKSRGRFQIAAPTMQIPAQLPNLSRQILAKMAVRGAQLPAQNALSAPELAFLGAQKWKLRRRDSLDSVTEDQLKQLAPKDALAGIEAQRLVKLSDGEAQNLADGLLQIAPGNALVMGEVAWANAHHLMQHTDKLTALSRKFPNNMLLCVAQSRFEAGNKASAAQVKWMEQAVRASPQSSFLWVELGEAHYDASNQIRRRRYQNQMSRAEKRTIGAIYPKWQAVLQKATQIDPKSAYAWARLSCAAAFNSDGSAAQSALDQAIATDASESAIYGWGFELCQPKWGGNAASVQKMARLAANNADKALINAHSIVDIYRNTNQYDQIEPILTTILQKDPQNASALTELGAISHYNHTDHAKAETLYRQALAIDPEEALANSQLGDLMFFVHRDARGSEALYRKAISIDKSDGYFHANLARTLASLNRQSEAVAEANLAKSLGFSDTNHQVWSATGVSP